MIFQGIWTSIAKKPYIFVIFQGGGGLDPLSPLWIRACTIINNGFSALSKGEDDNDIS